MGKKMTAAQEKIEPRFYALKEAVEAVKAGGVCQV